MKKLSLCILALVCLSFYSCEWFKTGGGEVTDSIDDRALLRIIPAVILIPVSIRGRIFFSLHGKLIRHQVQKRRLAGTITAVQYRDPVKYKLHPFSSAENMIRIDIGAGKFPAA